MSDAPDFIWVTKPPTLLAYGLAHVHKMTNSTEFVRRDPAVLAELPEVKAMLAAAVERAAEIVKRNHHKRAIYKNDYTEILALIPADAKAALDAYVAGKVREALERAFDALPKSGPVYSIKQSPLERRRSIGFADAIVDARNAIRALIEEAPK